MRKKLLFLLSSLNAGGAENQTVQLVNKIDSDAFAITLRYFDKREALLGALDMSQVESVECMDRKGRFDFSLLNKIGALTTRGKQDVVFCVTTHPMLYGYLVRLILRNKYKLVTVLHHTLQRPGTWQSIKTKLHRRILNRCDLIIFVCRNQLKYWVDHHNLDPSKCIYIYNGIDVDHFAARSEYGETADLAAKHGIGKEDVVLGNVAGFRQEKKQEDIVQAARVLRDSGYPIKVLLVGAGPRQQVVERHIESCNMREHVILAGLQKAVRPYLQLMDCFVLSSHQETFSLAALEAMAAGKPLVMTDVGGAGEMVENGVNGFLFSPGDTGQLVDRIKNLIDHNLFAAMGTSSRRIVTERFTLQQMVQEYERVL